MAAHALQRCHANGGTLEDHAPGTHTHTHTHTHTQSERERKHHTKINKSLQVGKNVEITQAVNVCKKCNSQSVCVCVFMNRLLIKQDSGLISGFLRLMFIWVHGLCGPANELRQNKQIKPWGESKGEDWGGVVVGECLRRERRGRGGEGRREGARCSLLAAIYRLII